MDTRCRSLGANRSCLVLVAASMRSRNVTWQFGAEGHVFFARFELLGRVAVLRSKCLEDAVRKLICMETCCEGFVNAMEPGRASLFI